MTEEIQAVLGNLYPNNKADSTLFKGKGCSECSNTGYNGRVGMFEVLLVTDQIARLILTSSDSLSIEKKAVEEGMITMKQDGYLKVLQGVTTIEEVLRVAQE